MLEILNKKLKIEKLSSFFNSILSSKRVICAFITAIVLMAISAIGFYLVSTNEAHYKKPIAKITSVVTTKDSLGYNNADNDSEQIYSQQIKAIIMNGKHKGEQIQLENKTSYSQINDLNFKVNDEVFISVEENADNKIKSSTIVDFKRDKYISYIAILFIVLIVLIGGFKGIRSLTSVIVNIIIFSIVLKLYLHGYNLIIVSSIASVLFIVISIALVSGINRKTATTVLGTIAGTLLSMLITVIVIIVTKEKGLHYEEMEFLTRPPEQMFIAGVLIGTLGGIMDIAITISSTIKELYDKNPDIETKILIKSGMEVGKDIMGTMSNTLAFAYISGSIPMMLLLLKNGYSTFEIVNFNICLEIIRALTGSIGIVISIPVTLYISILLLRKNKIGEIKL